MTPLIQDVISSPLKSKRFRAIVKLNGEKYSIDFGSKYAKTYIDGASETEKENYLKKLRELKLSDHHAYKVNSASLSMINELIENQ